MLANRKRIRHCVAFSESTTTARGIYGTTRVPCGIYFTFILYSSAMIHHSRLARDHCKLFKPKQFKVSASCRLMARRLQSIIFDQGSAPSHFLNLEITTFSNIYLVGGNRSAFLRQNRILKWQMSAM